MKAPMLAKWPAQRMNEVIAAAQDLSVARNVVSYADSSALLVAGVWVVWAKIHGFFGGAMRGMVSLVTTRLRLAACLLVVLCMSAGRAIAGEPGETFQFTKIELELLDKANQADREFERRGLAFNDPDTNAYIAEIGMKMVPETPLENDTWRFRVLRGSEADAYGLRAMARNNYPPTQMAATFEQLKSGYEVQLEKEAHGLYADHPRFDDRIKYVEETVEAMPPLSGTPIVGAREYSNQMQQVMRHDVPLEILAGRPRTALGVATRLTEMNPENSEDAYLLAEADRALGGRTPTPRPEEMTCSTTGASRTQLDQT